MHFSCMGPPAAGPGAAAAAFVAGQPANTEAPNQAANPAFAADAKDTAAAVVGNLSSLLACRLPQQCIAFGQSYCTLT